MFLMLGKKSWFYNCSTEGFSKTIINSLELIFRRDRQWLVLVYLLSTDIIIFLPTADNQMFSIFVSQVQNEQGILLFIN